MKLVIGKKPYFNNWKAPKTIIIVCIYMTTVFWLPPHWAVVPNLTLHISCGPESPTGSAPFLASQSSEVGSSPSSLLRSLPCIKGPLPSPLILEKRPLPEREMQNRVNLKSDLPSPTLQFQFSFLRPFVQCWFQMFTSLSTQIFPTSPAFQPDTNNGHLSTKYPLCMSPQYFLEFSFDPNNCTR